MMKLFGVLFKETPLLMAIGVREFYRSKIDLGFNIKYIDVYDCRDLFLLSASFGHFDSAIGKKGKIPKNKRVM